MNETKIFKSILLFVAITAFLTSCLTTDKRQDGKVDAAEARLQMAPIDKVLSAEEQKLLTPDAVIQNLKEGNARFMNNELTVRDHSALVRDASLGQHPRAVILSCSDSRVTVEDIFDKGIGDLFVCRIAGNFVDEDILGSMEYGCRISGAKLIVVMGHKHCGAIKSAIDNVHMGNITEMLLKIRPAVLLSLDFTGDRNSRNEDFVTYVAKLNVQNTVKTIKQKSPILRKMSENSEIKIIGAFYDLENGEVTFME